MRKTQKDRANPKVSEIAKVYNRLRDIRTELTCLEAGIKINPMLTDFEKSVLRPGIKASRYMVWSSQRDAHDLIRDIRESEE